MSDPKTGSYLIAEIQRLYQVQAQKDEQYAQLKAKYDKLEKKCAVQTIEIQYLKGKNGEDLCELCKELKKEKAKSADGHVDFVDEFENLQIEPSLKEVDERIDLFNSFGQSKSEFIVNGLQSKDQRARQMDAKLKVFKKIADKKLAAEQSKEKLLYMEKWIHEQAKNYKIKTVVQYLDQGNHPLCQQHQPAQDLKLVQKSKESKIQNCRSKKPKSGELLKENKILKSNIVAAQKLLNSTILDDDKDAQKKSEDDCEEVLSEMTFF